MNEPLVTIIVPAKDAQETVEKCMDSILSIDYANYEVIAIDDGSQDKTSQFLERYRPKIEIIANSLSLGPSESRNKAAQQGKGDYLAFTDADCIVDKDWLRGLLEGIKQFPQAVSCGGRQEIPHDAGDFQKEVFLFMKKNRFITDYMRAGKDAILEVSHNASCSVLYKREVFLKAGGFLKNLWPGEDVEFDYRLRKAGYKLVFNPKAIIYHYRPENIKKFCGMMYRYGWAQGFLVRKYGFFRRLQIVPFLSLTFSILFLLTLLFKFYLLGLLFIAVGASFLCIYFNKISFISILGILNWHFGFFRKFLEI